MKIRTGFVSNSSSSSFCIYGAIVPSDIDRDKLWNLKTLSHESGIADYSDEDLVGLFPWQMGAEETRAQFEKRVEDLIKEELGVELSCNWHTDGGYDG